MSKKSLRYEISKRLTTRFRLVEGEYEDLRLEPSIIPVTQTDELLRSPDVAQATGVTVGGVGNITGITVPAGKRWRVSCIEVKSTSGTWTASSLSITDGTHSMKVYAPASSSSTLLFSFGAPTVFDAGWTVTFYADSVSVAGSATVSCLVTEEEAY